MPLCRSPLFQRPVRCFELKDGGCSGRNFSIDNQYSDVIIPAYQIGLFFLIGVQTRHLYINRPTGEVIQKVEKI